MASTAAGVAVGSAIGNTIGGFFGGGSSEPAPQAVPAQQQQQQAQQQGDYCLASGQQFTKCMDDNGGDLQGCRWYLEQFKACLDAATKQ
ncbi:hypothetical protein E4U42_001109 [Claviceps africana]|uniref:Small unique nuclear receptor co-repressor n=1 Tax=Claviceps africana TaxID=83212 RepID=A0A8K0JA67_9HYPO|nr:hypothetical protein E4U42_001109 [Claviceps africana]